jgi:Mrp family chromosome partitioning ATPase
VIGKKTAGVFLVAAAGSTLKQDITNSVQVLETAGAHVFGVVTTKLPVKGPHAYSYGAYGYGELSVQDLVTASSHEDKARLARDKEPGSTYAR